MKRTVITLLLTIAAVGTLRAGDAARFHPLPDGQRPSGRYLVALSEATAVDDPSEVAAQLARIYGGRLEIFAEEGFRGFLIAMMPARARLLSNDPRVAYVAEQATEGQAMTDIVVPAAPVAVVVPRAAPTMPAAPRTEWTTGQTFWDSGEYSYDGAGNITAIGADSYAYDAFGRLQSATAKTPTVTDNVRTFEYDRYGNIKKITTDSGGKRWTEGAAVDAATNQLTDPCPSGVDACFQAVYDGSGNQTGQLPNDGQYRWDALGMLTRVKVPGRHEEYVYDANGERLVTIFPDTGVRRYTLRGSDNKVAREIARGADGKWSWSKDYVYRNGTLLAAYVAGENGDGPHRHYHVDHLGTTRVITDSAGYKLATHTYWPFGAEAPGSDADYERMKFTGHERDSNPYTPGYDLDYMHARYYSPIVGRFLSVDPSMDIKKALHEPQMWNRYSYVTNNPLRYTDPDGRDRYQEPGFTKPMTAENLAMDENTPAVIKGSFYAQGALLGMAGGYGVYRLGATAVGAYQAWRAASVAGATLKAVDQLSAKDGQIMRVAMRLAQAGKNTFENNASAVAEAVRQVIGPTGRLTPIGKIGNQEIYGSARTGIGLAQINGKTYVVRMKDFELDKVVGLFRK